MPFNLGGFGAAGGGAEGLEELLKRVFVEQMERKRAAQDDRRITQGDTRIAEDARQADMANALGKGRLGLETDEFGFRKERAGVDDKRYEGEAPIRATNMRLTAAQAGDIERRPQKDAEDRALTIARDATNHGYQMQEIGAQGANQLRVANVRHPDVAGSAAAQKEQNEVEDSLALIEQIRNDKALASSTGPVEGRGAGFLTAGPEGYTRVKALHDNLVSKLQLAQAGKLKGQGQISNMEREMLKNAATALQLKLGDADYLNELTKVQQQFERMRAGGAPAVQNGASVNLIWDGSKFVKPGGRQ